MQYAPTQVRTKFGGFHISTSGCTQNLPDFTHPNKDIPKTCPILDPNLWRGLFRGVCNTPLHGYTQKIVWFHISAYEYAQNPPSFIFPHPDTPKTLPILDPNLRRGTFWGRMQYTPTRVHPKNCPVSYYPIRIHQNPPDFRPKPSARDI